jgi:hypothetical protein
VAGAQQQVTVLIAEAADNDDAGGKLFGVFWSLKPVSKILL